MKFQISSAPGFYGNDVTDEEASRYAELLAEAVQKEFEIETEVVFTNCVQNQNADSDGEIQRWVNDYWLEVIE